MPGEWSALVDEAADCRSPNKQAISSVDQPLDDPGIGIPMQKGATTSNPAQLMLEELADVVADNGLVDMVEDDMAARGL